MGKYNFDYSVDINGIAKVTLTKAGIVFSKEAIALLGAPKYVNIGLDKQKGVMGVRSAEGNSGVKAFDFVTNEKRRNWIRVQSKPLLKEATALANVSLDESKPYLAFIEEDEGVKYLIVELKK